MKLNPFITDKCSGGMSWFANRILKITLPWENDCIIHDKRYWVGGTVKDRLDADKNLMVAVIQSGHPYWAIAMFLAVRLGGTPYLPFSWRWGYGRKYFSPYDK